jgi:carbonic anhydrase/acetyltransferase-like protein (isoleucine patch superfamily)
LKFQFKEFQPKISEKSFIAPGCIIIGEVEILDFASIWFNSVLRGDGGKIKIGEHSNIQDSCVLHEGVIVEEYVTVGHRAILHNCIVRKNALIGAGAIVWDGAEIGEEAMVGVGAVVPPNMKVKNRTLVLGVPAREIRNLSEEEINSNKMAAEYYEKLAEYYKKFFEKNDKIVEQFFKGG